MSSFLGIDTSNYTTSVGIYFSEDNKVINSKKILPVKSGEKGLRQSDAVFYHVNQFSTVFFEAIKNSTQMLPVAVGVSSKPRDEEGSYMPCFGVGVSFGKTISQLLNVPYYEFSHQMGHIVAALYSANKLNLLKKDFLAFHVSGGTTEALLVSPDKNKVLRTQIVAKTMDLNAGQLIDRVGVMLGLSFPAGIGLEKLALRCTDEFKIKPTLKNDDCCLSGVENLCLKMKNSQQKEEKIARFCIEYIGETIEKMCEKLLLKYGEMPVLFAGGVMSNMIIRKRMLKKFDAIFGEPSFSTDNAVGIAILTAIKAGVLQ